ncbi:MAG TPA: Hsp70 family protein [Bryobacteraceae bacterium]|jgi:molecular chaperone DnaK (HSP70)|nr:Hsp70 family protein [Bryobacteraceae bacterium]
MNIGIDLGTTNSALAYIDPQEAAEADFPPIHALPIEQQVDANRTAALRTLPSFLYLSELPVVGAYARDQGALVPTKTVHSAKSWLSNSEADRTAKILPWDSQEEGRVLSPVEASTRYLAHMREAWERGKHSPLAAQQVVLTVPASFDEEARELTVQAAHEAGIESLTLLEEPAAAFYAWIASHLARSNIELFDGQIVLVCDVGGGTSDFTLVRVDREGDRVQFTRTTVGRHLLLGGDNLDLTLSWLAESKLGKTLSLRQRSALRRQCSAAKERMLAPNGPASVDVTVVGAGSALIGGTLKTSIARDEVLELALGGFLPPCELADKPQQEKQSVFRELGLPYVSDPAITRHLAEFLNNSPAREHGVDAVLFNGGFFIPQVFRERVRDVVEHWFGRKPRLFENQDLDLAVAIGAAYYSYVRASGSGVLVRGGLPRAYFLGLQDSGSSSVRTVCLVPRGTEEGQEIRLAQPELQLVANTPVAFRLYSSLSRTEDAAGDVVSFTPSEDMLDPASDPRLHAPLRAVIRFGKGGERLVPVTVGARLSEVGTLDTWAESKVSDHRWRLQFQLRKGSDAPDPASVAAAGVRSGAVIGTEALAHAESLIEQVFGKSSGAFPPEQLPARLEQALSLGRASWPLAAIRALSDKLLSFADGRRKNAAHEARWLNLTGFCLRPGFGFPGDDFRIEQARRVYASGLTFGNQVQCVIDWWIFCGRIAGGLNRNQQADIFQRLSPVLLPKQKRKQRLNQALYREMWRTAASLELLPQQTKVQLGEILLDTIKRGEMTDAGLWCLSRLGARKLFRGPINLVVSPSVASRWVDTLLRLQHTPALLGAVVHIGQITGDVARDLPPATLESIRRACEASSHAAELLRQLSGEPEDLASSSRIFGEELPAGLVLAGAAQ